MEGAHLYGRLSGSGGGCLGRRALFGGRWRYGLRLGILILGRRLGGAGRRCPDPWLFDLEGSFYVCCLYLILFCDLFVVVVFINCWKLKPDHRGGGSLAVELLYSTNLRTRDFQLFPSSTLILDILVPSFSDLV